MKLSSIILEVTTNDGPGKPFLWSVINNTGEQCDCDEASTPDEAALAAAHSFIKMVTTGELRITLHE